MKNYKAFFFFFFLREILVPSSTQLKISNHISIDNARVLNLRLLLMIKAILIYATVRERIDINIIFIV